MFHDVSCFFVAPSIANEGEKSGILHCFVCLVFILNHLLQLMALVSERRVDLLPSMSMRCFCSNSVFDNNESL